MKWFWRCLVGVVALAAASPVAGCTSLLGDFSSGSAVPKEAGTGGDATSAGGDDIADGSMAAEASDQDASSAPDASGVCGAGQMRCAAGCVSVNDIHTCGDCNNDCAMLTHVAATGLACTNGTCTFTCNPGYAHCPGNAAAGCETNLSAISHCGACTTACDPDSGTPFCAPSGTTFACSNGCPAGTTECSGSCSDLTKDDSHCGDCGMACSGGMTCQSSACACPSPLTNCGGTCFETDGDPTHCGASCAVCPVPSNGTATCSQGNCGLTCNTGFSDCGVVGAAACQFDTSSNAAHCGMGCMPCGTGFICSGGVCKCPVGQTDCNGTCVNTATNANNCGGCGNVCPDDAPLCKASSCQCLSIKCGGFDCGCGASCCKVGTTLGCC